MSVEIANYPIDASEVTNFLLGHLADVGLDKLLGSGEPREYKERFINYEDY